MFPQSSLQGRWENKGRTFFFPSLLGRVQWKNPPVPVLSFDLGGLGASSQSIFGIWALCNFYITCLDILYYIRNFYVDLHCWASVPGCLHTEGTLTRTLLNVGNLH